MWQFLLSVLKRTQKVQRVMNDSELMNDTDKTSDILTKSA